MTVYLRTDECLRRERNYVSVLKKGLEIILKMQYFSDVWVGVQLREKKYLLKLRQEP